MGLLLLRDSLKGLTPMLLEETGTKQHHVKRQSKESAVDSGNYQTPKSHREEEAEMPVGLEEERLWGNLVEEQRGHTAFSSTAKGESRGGLCPLRTDLSHFNIKRIF